MYTYKYTLLKHVILHNAYYYNMQFLLFKNIMVVLFCIIYLFILVQDLINLLNDTISYY